MGDSWANVRDALERRTDRILDELRTEWETTETIEPIDYGPVPWYPDEPPESVDGVLDHFGGMSSVVVTYTPERAETALVYNRSGYWEPPGGVIEGRDPAAVTAVREAEEETGLDVEITGLLYAGRVTYRYDDGSRAPLPVATFVGHRTDGRLRVERERNDHPGVTRGVGLFGPDVLPENCRDRERILGALEGEGD